MTPRVAAAAIALLVAAWAPPGMAAEEPPAAVGFSLGARLSAAFPMGSVISDPGVGSILIDQLVALSLPVQLDVGVTIHRRWFLGAYAQYAWSVLQLGGCSVGDSCSVTGLHAGIQATYAFRDHGGPWAGLGTGWELMFTSYTGAGATTSIDVSGWEFVIFQAGWDVEVSPGWMVGPWISGSIGEFSRATSSTNVNGRPVDKALQNQALHGWLQLGVKGSFWL